MPTYEFRCPTCGATFDEVRTMAGADDPAHCLDGHEARRVFGFSGPMARTAPATRPPGKISKRVLRGPDVATHDHVAEHTHDDHHATHEHDHPHDHGHDHG